VAEDDSQEKTEEPSQRRIEKALEDGQVLSSKEMFVFTSLITGLIFVLGLGAVMPSLLDIWRGYFMLSSADDLQDQILQNITSALSDFLILSLVVAVPILVVTFATQTAVGGLHFVPKNLEFKASRIDPFAGLKRMFSVNGLVELVKAILKVGALGGASAFLIWQVLPKTLDLVHASLDWTILQITGDLVLLVSSLLVVLASIAALDYAYSHYTHIKKLRMSIQDLKDENKDSEGSPEVKARIRRIQIEASRRTAKAAAALNDIDQATAIITNPTHFAVALRYAPGDKGAPKIIAMGRGKLAERIIEKGQQAGITVFRSPLLARAIYFTGDIGQEINDRLYSAVATVLAYIYRLDRGEAVSEPDVDVPVDLMFTEDGRPAAQVER